MPTTLLLTRPQEASLRVQRAVEHALDQRIDTVISPILRIVDRAATAPTGAIPILTSEHGARRAGQMGCSGLVFCVGRRTAEIAAQFGMEPVSADGDGMSLIRLIETYPRDRPLVHIRGDHSAVDIVKALTESGFEASQTIAYAQEPASLSVQARQVIQRAGDIVAPVFSPRSAALLAEATQTAKATLRFVAISERAAAALGAPARIAANPDLSSMVAAICAELSPVKAR